MHWRPSVPRRTIEIRWRMFKSMLSNCSDMFILGTYWTTRYSMVSEKTCKIQSQNGPKLVANNYLVWSLTFTRHVTTNKIVMWETLPNNVDWDCFKTPAGDLEDSKFTSGGTLCILGSHTFLPISWMCKKQTSVSRSSTESEINSLDAGIRLDGIPALDLWDLIVPFFAKNTHQNDQVQGNLFSSPTRKKIHGKIVDLNNAEFISSNLNYSRKEALLYIFEDNEAVITMIIKGRSPTMRHVSRTHRVALDWLFDRINLDPKIEIKYINTKNPTCRHSNQRNNSHVMNWIICCICSISVISVPFVVLKRCRKEHKKMQVKKESQQNQSRRWIWSHDPAWGIRTCLPRLHRKAWETTDLKVKYLWARGMSSNQEREDLWCALAHQTTQNGTLTTSGLLKSGTLVKRWQQERRDPWGGQQFTQWRWYGLWHRHRIEPFAGVTVILAKGEWSIAKDIGPLFKRCNARHRQTFLRRTFMSSTVEASVFMWKDYSDNLHCKKTGNNLTLKQMFDISEKLTVERSDEIFGVSQISWEDSYLWSMMKKSSVSGM